MLPLLCTISLPINPFDFSVLSPYINGLMSALGFGATAAMVVFLIISGVMFIISVVRPR